MAGAYNYYIQVETRLAPGTTGKLQKQYSKIKLNPNVNKGMKDVTTQSKLFGGELTSIIGKFTKWYLIAGGVTTVIQGLKDAVRYVKELDSSLIELRKVTNLNNQELAQFTIQAMEAGEAVARTTAEIVQGASDFARAGYDAQTALDLSEQAAMLVNIGDGIDNVTQATSSMIAVMRGFNLETTDTMRILDVLNEVSNRFAIDTGMLANAVTRVSATMASANNTFEETVGLITGVTEVIRDKIVSLVLVIIQAKFVNQLSWVCNQRLVT